VDRADIKQYIGGPKIPSIYTILRSCINELIRCSVIHANERLPSFNTASISIYSQPESASSSLLKVCEICVGMSGRSLRRLCLLAHAYYVQQEACSLPAFLLSLKKAASDEVNSANRFE